jgi:tetratricopeptide (TPR) repeat protein
MMLKLGHRILLQVCMLFLTSICMAGEETWTEVKSPNFVVISDASPKQARRTAKSFEQFRLLVQTAMPKGTKLDPSVPLTIFAGRDERSLKILLGEDRQNKGATQLAGLFMAGPERNLIALRMDASGNQDYHVIYHEYTHMVLQLNFGRLPLWLNEGLAEFFAYSELMDKVSYLGRSSREARIALNENPMIPLETLLSVTEDSPHYLEQEKADIFYPESWALTHYLMIGDKRAHTKQLMTFIRLIQEGVSDREAANQAFGDLKALENILRNYLNLAASYSFEIPVELSVNEDQYEERTLPPAESLALRGELLVYKDEPARAKPLLDQAIAMDSKNARANEAMGQLFLYLKDQNQAQKYFSAAVALDSKSCTAYLFAARGKDSDTAEKYLRKAIAINPQFAPAYAQLAQLIKQKSKPAEALEFAEKSAALQPGTLAYKLITASILADMGKIEEAAEYGRQALTAARNENDRQQAESFLNHIGGSRIPKPQVKSLPKEYPQMPKAPVAQANPQNVPQMPKTPIGQANPQDGMMRSYREFEENRKAEEALMATIQPGSEAKIRGVLKSVQCQQPSVMNVVLEADGKQHKLHAENYFKVEYGTIGGRDEDLLPCQDLEGRRVEIKYLTVSQQDFSGLIKSISVIIGR